MWAWISLSRLTGIARSWYNGYVGLDQLHFLIAGFIGVMAGTTLGMKRAARMDGSNLRKLIYVVIGLCGLITVVRNL